MNEKTSYNRLKDEQSSYLKQHQDNPVHWWPYGPEAIQAAKDENKPIFLSIGYSSCHWCHVMAHESFEDKDTAEYLNQNFICIKVDREEYPDLDSYYQQACQMFSQSGGWPLSAFLLPDMRPFFVGTYFPKNPTNPNATSFMGLISELVRAYGQEMEKVEENASKITQALSDGIPIGEKIEFPDHFPAPAAIMAAVDQFADKKGGGFGSAPKFPQFAFYEFAIEQMLEGMVEKEQGQHVIDSLEKMLMGGIFDHARGGIHRYSTDDTWTVPHFEKMLYDQAGLLRLLAKFGLLYPSPLVFDALVSTMDYLENEMLGDENFFFSAQDADSEGHEGLYFTFTEEEFESVLNKASNEDDDLTEKQDQIKKWFNITAKGNFEQNLNVVSLNPEMRKEIFTQEGWEIVRRVRKALLEERKTRIPPATDSKGVASWNFMVASSLIDVMQYCQIDFIKKRATQIFNKCLDGIYQGFLVKTENSGMKLRHTTTKDFSLPYLEDFVNFAESQLRTYEISGNTIFKDNFRDTMEFIFSEFVEGDKILTRAKSSQEQENYPNQAFSPFDTSYKSAMGTLFSLTRRGAVLFMDPEFGSEVNAIQEEMKHLILKNPLAAGEAIRSCIYPPNAYRVIKAPAKWLEDSRYLQFISYFLPRFVFDYHQDKEEEWEICNLQQCELKGEGLANFMETLKPQEQQEPQSES